MDTLLVQFKDFTGCTNDDEAKRLLLTYNNNLERAVDRYFRQQSRDSSAGSSSSTQPSARANIGDDDSDVEYMDTETAPPPPKRPMRQATISNGITRSQRTSRSANNVTDLLPGNSRNGAAESDEVRRPILPVHGQMIQESFEQSWRPLHPVATAGAFQAAVNVSMPRLVLHNGAANGDQSRKNGSLQTLFAPPIDLVFMAPWEHARREAVSQNKWLLVNLQKNSEFACSCLNRDIWSKDVVKEMVKNNFLFWQMGDDSADCKRVSAYYNVVKYPCVIIVDPRTGEKVKTLDRIKEPISFLEDLSEFLTVNPDFNAYDQKLVEFYRQTNGFASPKVNSANVTPTRKRRRNTGEDNEPGPSVEKKKAKQSGGDEEMAEIDEICKNGTKLTTVDPEDWRKFVDAGSRTTRQIRIVFRLPNTTTKLKALFVFIDGRGLNSREHVLILSYPRREYSLDGNQSQTLEKLGFNNQEVIHVERK
uniref:UAS domain-containing protein n=1 Tax=Panagrolaimus sp. JU765 TaxID=591449 RepID=A0AC34QHA6_9BILA